MNWLRKWLHKAPQITVEPTEKEKLIQELIRDEGVVLHAYNDHLGYTTIGIGRLIDKRRGGGITQEEAEYLLNNDVDKVIAQVEKALPWVIMKPEPIRRALFNMAFQMGLQGLLKFKNTLGLIKDGRYAEAAENAKKSLWYRQTPKRAERVIELIRNG